MEFDKKEYKNKQLAEWNKAASGWAKWCKLFEVGAQHISNQMIKLATIEKGHRVLDVGTGIGEPAISASTVVGPDGHVTATEISDQMLAVARERAEKQGLNNITFHISDAENLELGEELFDAVLSRWVLIFVTDLNATAAAIHRNLKPGGKLVATVWPDPMKVSFGKVVFGTIMLLLKPPKPPKGTPGIFSLADTSPLEEALKEQGFNRVEKQSLKFDIILDSVEKFIEFTKDVSAPINAMLSNLPEEKRNEVWNAMGKAASEYENNGKIILPNEAHVIIATV